MEMGTFKSLFAGIKLKAASLDLVVSIVVAASEVLGIAK
jgi:hypothetical protein